MLISYQVFDSLFISMLLLFVVCIVHTLAVTHIYICMIMYTDVESVWECVYVCECMGMCVCVCDCVSVW